MTATRYGGKRYNKHSKAKRTQRRRQRGGGVEYDNDLIKHLFDSVNKPSEEDAKKMLVGEKILNKSTFGSKYTFNESNISNLLNRLNLIHMIKNKTDTITITSDTKTSQKYSDFRSDTITKIFQAYPALYTDRFSNMVKDIISKISVNNTFDNFKNTDRVVRLKEYILTSSTGTTIDKKTVNKAYFVYQLLKEFIEKSTLKYEYYILNTDKLNIAFSDLVAAINETKTDYLDTATNAALQTGITVSTNNIKAIIDEVYHIITSILIVDYKIPPLTETIQTISSGSAPGSAALGSSSATSSLVNVVDDVLIVTSPTADKAILVYVGLKADTTTSTVVVDDANIHYAVIDAVATGTVISDTDDIFPQSPIPMIKYK